MEVAQMHWSVMVECSRKTVAAVVCPALAALVAFTTNLHHHHDDRGLHIHGVGGGHRGHPTITITAANHIGPLTHALALALAHAIPRTNEMAITTVITDVLATATTTTTLAAANHISPLDHDTDPDRRRLGLLLQRFTFGGLRGVEAAARAAQSGGSGGGHEDRKEAWSAMVPWMIFVQAFLAVWAAGHHGWKWWRCRQARADDDAAVAAADEARSTIVGSVGSVLEMQPQGSSSSSSSSSSSRSSSSRLRHRPTNEMAITTIITDVLATATTTTETVTAVITKLGSPAAVCVPCLLWGRTTGQEGGDQLDKCFGRADTRSRLDSNR
ncbi:hypothetical protein F4780DRAFT_791773 [Xylariomycetidae sp. FL0641]|nr:hypothetical protein F4780DRAFT_791773 [Xylariomycetidae sp. FL0641]